MHFLAATLCLLAASSTLVSATGQLGFALGDKNADGSCKYVHGHQVPSSAILTYLQNDFRLRSGL